jgi:hypothetical protein
MSKMASQHTSAILNLALTTLNKVLDQKYKELHEREINSSLLLTKVIKTLFCEPYIHNEQTVACLEGHYEIKRCSIIFISLRYLFCTSLTEFQMKFMQKRHKVNQNFVLTEEMTVEVNFLTSEL